MKTLLRRFAAAFAAALGFSLPASASTAGGIDYTDLWFNPSESGWGVNLIQQYETIFATLFVYGADNSARWFVASDLRGGPDSFTGTLYRTNGPAFSAPWSGGATVTAVGSMTLTFSSFNTGTLTYTVDGAAVTKTIQRQSWRPANLQGTYIGGVVATASGCSNPGDNGPILATGRIRVTHGGGNPTLSVEFRNAAGTNATCTYSGPFTPTGRLGLVSGSFNCTLGSTGTFTLSEVDVSRNGLTALYSARDQFCSYSGYFGGPRDVLN